MPEIKINIKNKIAYSANARACIVRDNSDYVIKFDFDAEWGAFDAKTARFAYSGSYVDVPFTGDSVTTPVISTGRVVEIGVYAGNLSTTTPASVPLLPSIRSKGGAPIEPEGSVYDKIMALIDTLGGSTPATADRLGMIKVGKNLSITEDGTLSADASGGGSGTTEITDDGAGNIVIVSLAAGLVAVDDGSGNITFGGD